VATPGRVTRYAEPQGRDGRQPVRAGERRTSGCWPRPSSDTRGAVAGPSAAIIRKIARRAAARISVTLDVPRTGDQRLARRWRTGRSGCSRRENNRSASDSCAGDGRRTPTRRHRGIPGRHAGSGVLGPESGWPAGRGRWGDLLRRDPVVTRPAADCEATRPPTRTGAANEGRGRRRVRRAGRTMSMHVNACCWPGTRQAGQDGLSREEVVSSETSTGTPATMQYEHGRSTPTGAGLVTAKWSSTAGRPRRQHGTRSSARRGDDEAGPLKTVPPTSRGCYGCLHQHPPCGAMRGSARLPDGRSVASHRWTAARGARPGHGGGIRWPETTCPRGSR